MSRQTKYDAAPDWTNQVKIGTDKTSAGPRCARWNDKDYVVWRNKRHSNIYFSCGSETNWSVPLIQPDGGTLDAPAIAAFNDRLFVAWRGSDDTCIWYATIDENPSWSLQTQLTFSPTTANGPALATYNNTLYMAWAGMDNLIWYCTYDGKTWSPPEHVSNPSQPQFTISYSPALAAADNALHLAWPDAYGQLNHSVYSGQWSVPHVLPQAQSKDAPALAGYDNGLAMLWWQSPDTIYWSTCPNGTEDWSTPTRTTPGGTEKSPGLCGDATGIRAVWCGVNHDHIWTSTLASTVPPTPPVANRPVPPSIDSVLPNQVWGTVQLNTYVTVTVTPSGGTPNTLPAVPTDANGNWSVDLDPPVTDGVIVSATASFGKGGTASDAFVRTIEQLYVPSPVLDSVGETSCSGTATAGQNILGWRSADGTKMLELTLSGDTTAFNTLYLNGLTLADHDQLNVVSADPITGVMTPYNSKPEGYSSS